MACIKDITTYYVLYAFRYPSGDDAGRPGGTRGDAGTDGDDDSRVGLNRPWVFFVLLRLLTTVVPDISRLDRRFADVTPPPGKQAALRRAR